MPAAKKATPFACRPHPHLYEINTWAWLEELSARAGRRVTLAGVPDAEWDALAEQGFDLVWLMGVWKRSPTSRRIARAEPSLHRRYDEALPGWTAEQVVGSPYAVQDYRLDPRLGTWPQLDRAREKLHARGMGLILDFVPNHTARDHPWTRGHPDYYVQSTEADWREKPDAFFPVKTKSGRTAYLACGRDPYFPPWTDTAQLNYCHPAARAALLDTLRAIAAHADGVRCDMAMLVLNDIFTRTWCRQLAGAAPPAEEFWAESVAALPGFLWLAEAYWDTEWRLQELGFQFTYDKRLYDRLRHASPPEVRAHLEGAPEFENRLVRFLENHDEPRSLEVFGRERLPALATLVATLPGMRFYHQGQLEGRRIHLPVQLARAADEAPDPEIRALYDKLLRLTNDDAFHHGAWRLLEVEAVGDDPGFANLLAYHWRLENELKVVVVNLGDYSVQGHVRLGGEVEAGGQYDFLDQLNDQTYQRAGDDLTRYGLYVRLDAFRAHLFDVTPR